MKKLKIRGNELKRLGYRDDKAITKALQIIRTNFKRGDKMDLLVTLEKILHTPDDYIDDRIFGELALMLTQKQDPRKDNKPLIIRKKPIDYEVFGERYIDPEALNQMDMAMKLPINVKGALMADAHVGYGLPIGGVVAAHNAVMPYGVGMDIACRMCLSVYPLSPKIIDGQRDRLKNILIENSRFGLAEFNDIGDHELMERPEFKEVPFIKSLKKTFYKQLGTSGHGNHFVDMGYVEIDNSTDELDLKKGAYFAILSHSGSRGFGAEVARHYTRIAKEKLGLKGEAANLAWLDINSEEGIEYWKAMTLAGAYSAANHRIIHKKFSKALGEKALLIIENHHNFAWKERISDTEELVIHRKGATPAAIGDIGIIPGDMIAPAYIVSGKGNSYSLESAAHGAGRLLSRRKAKSTITMSSMKKNLKHAGVELIGGGPDESPEVYKDIHQVMSAQNDLVNILARFYPKIVRME